MNKSRIKLRLAVALVATLSVMPTGFSAETTESRLDPVSFVCRIYKHGIPYVPARSYTVADVDALLKVLNDPAEKPYWANTLITLGIIGAPRVTQPIIDFLERRFQGEVTLEEFNALLSAPLALGHAAMHGNQAALDYLQQHHTLAAWEEMDPGWTFQRYRGHTRNVLMVKMVIRALAFACQPSSKALLEKMRDSDATEYVELRQHALADITEALEFFEQLAEKGPERTFVYTAPEPATPPKNQEPPNPEDRP